MTEKRRKREIDSHNVFLSSLMKDVRKGMLLPAAFQRPYVWTKEDVLHLIRSIMEGYPIGSFLTWSPWGAADTSRMGRHRLGPIVGSADTGTNAPSFLLDGQNRLTTMAWLTRNIADPVPTDLSGQEKQTWGSGDSLVLDLAARAIKFVPESEVNVGFRLPISALFHGNLNQEMRSREKTQWAGVPIADIDDAAQWIDDTRYAFMEAKVVVTDIRYATVEEAKDAFLHICKLGVPMSEADFEAAVAWAVSNA